MRAPPWPDGIRRNSNITYHTLFHVEHNPFTLMHLHLKNHLKPSLSNPAYLEDLRLRIAEFADLVRNRPFMAPYDDAQARSRNLRAIDALEKAGDYVHMTALIAEKEEGGKI